MKTEYNELYYNSKRLNRLHELAAEYCIDPSVVLTAAETLGPNEDNDALITFLDDYVMSQYFAL